MYQTPSYTRLRRRHARAVCRALFQAAWGDPPAACTHEAHLQSSRVAVAATRARCLLNGGPYSKVLCLPSPSPPLWWASTLSPPP